MAGVNIKVDKKLYDEYKKKCDEEGVKYRHHLVVKMREVAYGYAILNRKRHFVRDSKTS